MSSLTDDFTAAAERYRHELRVHCYRMVGSYDEAEDLVQETYLKAWRRREALHDRAALRAWLYRIATNACLDALERTPSRTAVTSLTPYPDRLLDAAASATDRPDAVVVSRETVSLAFLVAVQQLPPRQRAVLILRDVLGWTAAETAELLDMTVTAVNSAVRRARPVVREHLPAGRLAAADDEERAVVERYMRALVTADESALADLLRQDVRVSQQPGAGGNMTAEPTSYAGRDLVIAAWAPATGTLEWQFRTTAANRQPALAIYVRERGSTVDFRAFGLTVLTIVAGQVAEVAVFSNDVLAAFELPPMIGPSR
jgi:RNA polymerase sigma-70 factor, ECF subfamily